MNAVRRLSLVALTIGALHLVFGGIVRITGSGMGCGDHWPKCYGRWFPPFDRPDLVIEVTHRYLAALLVASVLALLVVAFTRRAEPGVAGPGGVLRAAAVALALVVSAALFGAVTVIVGNAPYATAGHWLLAALTIAAIATAAIRAGALGGARALVEAARDRVRRGTAAAAGLALVVVMLGGLTAKIPGAAWGCLGFPLCNGELLPSQGPQHVQMTHRLFAILLLFHLIGLVIASAKRREAPVVRGALGLALGLVGAQILLAAGMVSMTLPPVMRSAHQALGVAIWVTVFAAAYLARIASGGSAVRAPAADRPPAVPRAAAGGAA